MELKQARQIAKSFDLSEERFSYNQSIHFHFLGKGFYVASRRTKTNTQLPLLSKLSADDFTKRCAKAEHKPKTNSEKFALSCVKDALKRVTLKSHSYPGVIYYPEFNSFSVLGDGFPMARFVFSRDFKQTFFMFSYDRKLQHLSNPNSIPHIFPTTELPQWLGHISI